MKATMWIKPFLFALLVLVAPIATYYVYYVEARETILLDRFHAHLANAGAQTEARLSSAFSILRNNPSLADSLCRNAGGPQSLSDGGAGILSLRLGDQCEVRRDASELVANVDPERRFHDVIILSDKGVVYQRDAQNGRIDSAQLAVAEESYERSSNARVTDPLRRMRVTYQGRSFLIFSQPLFLVDARAASAGDAIAPAPPPVAPAAEATAAWRIVGLLDEDTFNGLKWGASSANVAVVALILLGLVLGGPFLKLWYLGRFEPLSRFDVLLLIAAGFGLVAMFTVALLAWNTEMRLTKYSDDRLEDIAQKLGKRTQQEVESAVESLNLLEQPMLKAYDERRNDPPGPEKDCPYLAEKAPTVAGDLFLRWPTETAGYRPLVMAYLMDAKGCQLVKWSSAPTGTAPGRFGDRTYFLRALPHPRAPGDLYELVNGRRYFQEVITSRTTGERELVFSKPVERAAERAEERACEGAEPCVSVVVGKLRALESVLPSSYGAMLVDEDTTIAWSSEEGRSSELNLAKELDAPERLRATVRLAVAGRDTSEARFDAVYRGSPHRFLVAPLGVGELALVVFYERDVVLSTVLESAGAAAVAWLIWMLAFGLLVLAFWCANHMTERAVRREPVLLAAALLVLGGIGWIALAVPWLLIVGTLGFPMLMLWVSSRTDRLPKNARLRRSLLMLATWFAVLMTAALPMVVFYEDASLRAVSAQLRSSAFQATHAARLREQAFMEWKHRVGKPEWASWASFVEGDDTYPFKLGVDYEIVGNASVTSACSGFRLVCAILYYLPDYSAGAAGRHAMYRAPEPTMAERRGVRKELLGHAPPVGFAFLLAATLLCAALLAVGIWHLMVRLFGLHAENVVEVSSFVLPQPDEKAHWLVYGAARANREENHFGPLQARAKKWVDLRDQREDGNDAGDHSLDAIAFDEFDSGLNSIATLNQRVELLERVLREKYRVIMLFVSTDPLNFASATHHSAENTALLSRFAAALARFKVVYAGAAQDGEEPSRSPRPSLVQRVLEIVGMKEQPGARLAVVAAECRHPDLWEIREEVRKQTGLQGWTEAQIIQHVQGRANAIYQRMWLQCTRAEKFTLIELARGNPINPNNWDAARRLRVRGYVRVDPFYRIGSESLRQFVLQMEQIEDLQSWNEASPGAWTQIKVPLLVLFIGTLVFIGVTQPNVFNSVLAFLMAGAAGAPFLFNALNARLQRAV